MNKNSRPIFVASLLLSLVFIVAPIVQSFQYSGKIISSALVVPILFLGITSYSLYYYRKKKAQKEALRHRGKIIKVQVKDIFSQYKNKQGTRYYLSAISAEYPETNFIEEYTNEQYFFLKKHLRAGDEIEIFMDYQNPSVFFMDFALIESKYSGKPEVPQDEQFESNDLMHIKVGANAVLKIIGMLLAGFGLFSLLPVVLFYFVDGADVGEHIPTHVFEIRGWVSFGCIVVGIILIRSSWMRMRTKKEAMLFSPKVPKGFDGFPS